MGSAYTSGRPGALGWVVSPSGGLRWHARGLMRRRRLWRPFLAGLGDWLAGWRPEADGLLLLGASAGWCLPDRFLTRFGRVEAIDLDPLAGPLIRLLHGRAVTAAGGRLVTRRTDLFAGLEALLAERPGDALLFCNLLGQRALHHDEPDAAERELAGLGARLAGRRWASFHERLSGPAPDGPDPAPCDLAGRLDAEALAHRLGLAGEWDDHLTTAVLPADVPRRLLPWRFRAERLHWIEAGVGG